jgi:hypothetical protein
MLEWGALEPPDLGAFEKLTYLPLTDGAARDPSFQKLLAEMIASTYFDKTSCLIIRLPHADEDMVEVTARMIVTLEGVRNGGLRLPQVQSRNVLLIDDDLAEETLVHAGNRLTFVAHETFEYWRYTRAVYRSAAKVLFYLDDERKYSAAAIKPLIADALGQPATLLVATRPAHRDFDIP